ncbi:hypothetical protein I6B53_03840 [Schaalia sp. 19OD2882]|uniref:hypothetical protein n=1 Tax=Schaalia sp. 19OD2882 TaxID=2794089 RepID=UPI001C1F1A81|nr:hypothetical protein [Schaalia sp. 19OD2882]QWW20235.1 hypothetical protein I6B53_03840 [Schaalia sp. 19OD2882]
MKALKSLAAIAGVAALAISLTACNAVQNIAERQIEKAIEEQASGSDVRLDVTGDGVDVPADFPADIPLPSAKPNLVTDQSGGYLLVWAEGSKQDFDAQVAAMEAAGFTAEDLGQPTEGLSNVAFQNNSWTVTLTLAGQKGLSMLVVPIGG